MALTRATPPRGLCFAHACMPPHILQVQRQPCLSCDCGRHGDEGLVAGAARAPGEAEDIRASHQWSDGHLQAKRPYEVALQHYPSTRDANGIAAVLNKADAVLLATSITPPPAAHHLPRFSGCTLTHPLWHGFASPCDLARPPPPRFCSRLWGGAAQSKAWMRTHMLHAQARVTTHQHARRLCTLIHPF